MRAARATRGRFAARALERPRRFVPTRAMVQVMSENPIRPQSDADLRPDETSWASSPAARRTMQKNRGRDTHPERKIRSELHRRGLRYRVNQKVPGMPRRTMDVSWPALRIAVFVDGCFWHGCPSHGTAPKAHADFWAKKIQGNRLRDSETTAHLANLGWLVLRFWEHDDPVHVADVIASSVADRRNHSARTTPRSG